MLSGNDYGEKRLKHWASCQQIRHYRDLTTIILYFLHTEHAQERNALRNNDNRWLFPANKAFRRLYLVNCYAKIRAYYVQERTRSLRLQREDNYFILSAIRWSKTVYSHPKKIIQNTLIVRIDTHGYSLLQSVKEMRFWNWTKNAIIS